jgi:predicted DNA-binding transcriptional regulator YafY
MPLPEIAVSRAARLLDLLQHLRRHRAPVSGRELAAGLGISLRTLYRDVATLQGQGADITGSPGQGYRLQPGFTLPPLMFSHGELDALLLGMAWVADRGDPELQRSARDALAKINAVLPEELRCDPDDATMLVGPGGPPAGDGATVARLRAAIRDERRVDLDYRDQHGERSRRTVWPCTIAVFKRVRIVVAWCELRRGFRHFRLDRIAALAVRPDRYPRRRRDLLRAWRATLETP